MSEQTTETLTADAALATAARLLHKAESTPDLALLLERLAERWINIAGLLVSREPV